jgi:guanylate kinase
LLQRVPDLWLSRSWTTRPRRPGERPDAYHFVDEKAFRAHADAGGFLEWVELWPGQLSGTPVPSPPPGHDILLEIDVRGARQVRGRFAEAVLILVVPPSREVQAERLRLRGDPEERVAARLALSDEEEEEGRRLADHIVVNDDLDRAVEELTGIVEAHRSR